MHKKRLIFWSACMGMLLFGVVLITLGSIAPLLREKLALDDVSSGTLFAILPFGILAGSLLFGPFTDKYGYRVILSISCLLMFLGFEGIALAISEEILSLCIFVIGFGGGVVNGATNAVVSDISEDSRSADMSLLGVSYAAGALGMPLLLGILEHTFSFETILMATGLLTCAIGIIFLLIKFPSPKQSQGIKMSQVRTLVSDGTLWLIAFFLFFQSSLEGLVNNWTTSYLTGHLIMAQNAALFALSTVIAGMAAMRLLLGTALRQMPARIIMTISFILIISGSLLLKTGIAYAVFTGLILMGSGLAAGFPVMLGYTGDRYTGMSGTAFSFVLFIALTGNMILNYAMGVISRTWGISLFLFVILGISAVLILIFVLITRNLNKKPIN